MSKTLSPETIRKILDMRKQGKYLKEIARELNIDSHTVRKYTVLHGLDSVEILNPNWTEKEDEMIKDLYLNQGKSTSEIAEKMNKSKIAVRKYLVRHGIREPRKITRNEKEDFTAQLPPPVEDPVFYPERKITKKTVIVNGKKYTDVTEVFGS